MMLKEGDVLYLDPSKCRIDEHYDFSGKRYTYDELFNTPFVVTMTRYERGNFDIAIRWLDGTKWWWGQIGSSEPWTDKFITEKVYLRDKKIKE